VLNALQAIPWEPAGATQIQDDIKAMCIVHQCITKDGLAKEKAKPSRAATGSEMMVRVTCETSFALPVDCVARGFDT
jgi:hypothetical protein